MSENQASANSADFISLGDEYLHRGFIIDLVKGSFIAPNGERFERDIVRHPGAVGVVPWHEDDTITLVRQFRPALGEYLLELPAGKLDIAGEDPQEAAKRELSEEVGLSSENLIYLCRIANSPGFADEVSWIYLAQDLRAAPLDRHGIEEEFLSVVRIASTDIVPMIASGEIKNSIAVAGLLMAREVKLRDGHGKTDG